MRHQTPGLHEIDWQSCLLLAIGLIIKCYCGY